jgi:hypothetical protein
VLVEVGGWRVVLAMDVLTRVCPFGEMVTVWMGRGVAEEGGALGAVFGDEALGHRGRELVLAAEVLGEGDDVLEDVAFHLPPRSVL